MREPKAGRIPARGIGPIESRVASRILQLAAAAALLLGAADARAFAWFDGKLELHGFVAQQIRTLANDLDPEEEFDLAQWYNVVNLELEAKPFPRGIGPLEIVEFYVRGEARYDCLWTRGCGMFPSVDTYGNRAEHLPPRLIDARLSGRAGTLKTNDRRFYSNMDRENYELFNRGDTRNFSQTPLTFDRLPGFVSLFNNSRGPNQVFEPIGPDFGDDSSPYVFDGILDRCIFASRTSRGGENGNIFEILGPWNPSCPIREVGALRFKPNPFSTIDANPTLMGVDRLPGTGDEPGDPARFGAPIIPNGRGELPYRPAPWHSVMERGVGNQQAQGLYVPSAALVRELKSGHLDGIDQNFGQQELAWNRGASQQDEKELKEAYADIEAFEGRLWLRIGKQAIVWGKTELFRNTDQFNPQDFALSSLPSLEESRIALWSARGTWSFYNFGKIEDVRLELAVNIDDFEPADLGRCGEPFSVEAVCGLTLGYFAHGISGAGLAGRNAPEAPWDDVQGLEGGARVEWRYKRFSFQLSDFYGYDDFPHVRRINTYERNVDPTSGRPRKAGHRGSCATGNERDCLGGRTGVALDATGNPLRYVDTNLDGYPDTVLDRSAGTIWGTGSLIVDPAFKSEVLAYQSANQTAFAMASTLCGTAAESDPALCGFAAFNGQSGPGGAASPIAAGASALLAGSSAAAISATNNRALCNSPPGTPSASCRVAVSGALVRINTDPGDNVGAFSDGGVSLFALVGQALGQGLTPHQEALLGCGPFYQADCDIDGIDMMNAEASVLLQSWPGFDGSTGSIDTYDVRDRSFWHPGTIGFVGGPVATRHENGQTYILPGARGPLDPGYAVGIDGCAGPGPFGCNAGDNGRTTAARLLAQPYTAQPFRSELAAVSWNLLQIVATGGRDPNPDFPALTEFDPFDPFGLGIITRGPYTGQLRPGVDPTLVDGVTPVACGLYKIALCETVRGFLSAAGVRRNDVRAGGKNGYGRRDFVWHSSGELVVEYDKRNVLGFAFDFDESVTKSNWGVEMTWINRQIFLDNDEFDGISESGTVNMTISVDRPTFINFLNPGRTFFFNSQIFLQYIDDYHDNFYANGPVNVLGTLTAFTGYHQDRLMIYNTLVYDVMSQSGAILPSVVYRFTESFSATLGANIFMGRQQMIDSPINEIRPGVNRVGRNAYEDGIETGLSAVREHDEIYLQIRYTF